MDSLRRFNRAHLPYYQDWIRKVAGRKDIFVRHADLGWARRVSPKGSRLEWYYGGGIAWAWGNTIALDCYYLEEERYVVNEARAIILHEAGHIMCRRTGPPHGRAGNEYAAAVWSMGKACRLGYEEEGRVLHGAAMSWARETGWWGRNYRIAYRMLRRAGVL